MVDKSNWDDRIASEQAAARATELQKRIDELRAHHPVTADDAAHAIRRAEEAHERAKNAELAAADRFTKCARLHDELAEILDYAAEHGRGDPVQYRASANWHRK